LCLTCGASVCNCEVEIRESSGMCRPILVSFTPSLSSFSHSLIL
jgi:hypothetical protein